MSNVRFICQKGLAVDQIDAIFKTLAIYPPALKDGLKGRLYYYILVGKSLEEDSQPLYVE